MKVSMFYIISLFLAVASTCAVSAQNDATIQLSVSSKTNYSIIIPANPTLQEKTAAQELKLHLDQISSANFKILRESGEQTKNKAIYLGQVKAFAKTFPEINISKLGRDGIVLKSKNGNIFLAGKAPRGVIYAVDTFLEDFCRVRWWTSKVSYIPREPSLKVRCPDLVYAPKLLYREAYYTDAFNGVFAARCKFNGHYEKIPLAYGGHYKIVGWCHTFHRLLPAKKYFKSHPEWYNMIAGKRTAGKGWQTGLCMSNNEMRKELTKNALKWLRANPEAGIISISQDDHQKACQCEKCRIYADSPSDQLIWFVNKVAEDIEKEFPKVYVETLAYQYTRKPPKKVKPRKNVIIRLCSIEASFSQALATSPQNAEFRKNIEGWSKIAPQLFIWDYVANFSNYLMPHPNIHVLASNIRFFIKNKTIGLFEQGDSGSNCGDFAELRVWLLAHLMWNPSLDEKSLIKEFMNGYYGPAGKPLMAYLDLIANAVESSETYLSCYMDNAPWLGLETWCKAVALFNEAECLVKDNPELKQRVRRSRMSLDFVWIKQGDMMKCGTALKKMPPQVPLDKQKFCSNFIKAAHEFNLSKFSEGVYLKSVEAGLLAGNALLKLPPLCIGLTPDDWFDVQDFGFRLARVGRWSFYEKDSKASDGHAVRMPAHHKQWAVQYPIPSLTESFRCYVVIRCVTKVGGKNKGSAFKAGIYNPETKKPQKQIIKSVSDVADGKYHTYDLGVCDKKDRSTYVWIAPAKNPEVESVFVDRIFFIKEK